MSNYVLTPQAVRKLRGALAANPGNSGAGGTPSPVNIDDFPLPFTVRWSASEWWVNESSPGSWVIWLPNPQEMVWYNGRYIPPYSSSGTITIHGQTYPRGTIFPAEYLPAGWYRMGRTPPSTTAVKIAVRGTYWVFIPDSSSTSSDTQLCIAEVGYANGRATVKQIIDSAIVLDDSGGSVVPDDISTEFIPEPPSGTTPDGDEGELQIKGFKAGQPADTNTLPDYLGGAAAIPSGGISLVCRSVDTNGNRLLFYLPLAAIWGDGSSGGLPLPEVTYLDDVTWDPSNHQLVKHWVKKNIVTGVETPIQGAPQGKTATINTTPISSIIN